MDTKAISQLFQEHTDQVRTILEKATQKLEATDARLMEIEQKMARPRGGDGYDSTPKSLGAKFIEQDGLKDFAQRNARNDRFQFETKATLTSSTSNAAGSVGAGIQAYRDPNIVPLVQRRPIIRDLLTVLQMSGNAVEVLKQTGRTNNAAPVAETALKPESDMQFGLDTVPARVIAHWTKASRQVLDDVPQLMGIIDTELLDGLALKEEVQILNGDGTGQNLEGLIPQATDFAAPFPVTDPTMLDTLGLAILQGALAEHPATGIVMHPSDWTRITLMKDADGNYIMGAPGTSIDQRVFGLPVVVTQAIAQDTFLLGDWRAAATLYDRWTARVEVGTVNDDFIRNLVTVLAEERIALAAKDTTALVHGDFGNVA
ncbi:phage major capsid protein [Microvirga sp. 3-52]|uniref:phage major capsid protein n=1 Tax=Microvirga sp. 3-52 TaxID=2792425 RepID=UPI001AC464C2|nr:phage major capsid protein [Microvirga sp. 3-52]MBO1903999.1 phage major capsid protein [Microvirga sp. 3-52]MBS7451610.1 phage major capsid protein [Microvirga sp. 3-52]